MTFSSATQVRGLRAAVVFYGRSPKPLDLVKDIQAPVLAHYGEKDPAVNQDIPSTEEAMKKYKQILHVQNLSRGSARVSCRYQSGALPRRCGQGGLGDNVSLFQEAPAGLTKSPISRLLSRDSQHGCIQPQL